MFLKQFLNSGFSVIPNVTTPLLTPALSTLSPGRHPPPALLHLPLCCPHHWCLRLKVSEIMQERTVFSENEIKTKTRSLF